MLDNNERFKSVSKLVNHLSYDKLAIKSSFIVIKQFLKPLTLLMGFKNARLTSLYIFQKIVECELPLLR